MCQLVSRFGSLAPVLIGVCLLHGAVSRAADRPDVVVTDAARQVHAAGFVFDGHNDLPWELRVSAGGSFDKADIAAGVPKFHTDIPR